MGDRAASLVSGATVGVGNTGRGGIEGRFTGGIVGSGLTDDSVASEGVLVGAGVVETGGKVLRGITGGVVIAAGAVGNGVGLIRTGIEGEGRVLGVIETVGGGVAEAADATVGDGLGRGRRLGDGRVVGEEEAAGLGIAEVATVGAGVRVAARTGVALGATTLGVATTVAAGVEEAAVSGGGTNFFGGAFGGGVASALILVRARSAAERSETEVQPLSTFTSVTRSLTRRGRKIFRTSLRTGTETSSSVPLILAGISVLRSRRNR
jgi:hypothetical protein